MTSKQATAFLTLDFTILLKDKQIIRCKYHKRFSVIILELVNLPDGLDLRGRVNPIFSIHQLSIGHQHQNLFTGVMLWPLHLVISKFLKKQTH